MLNRDKQIELSRFEFFFKFVDPLTSGNRTTHFTLREHLYLCKPSAENSLPSSF
jgi:hypothetical protein